MLRWRSGSSGRGEVMGVVRGWGWPASRCRRCRRGRRRGRCGRRGGTGCGAVVSSGGSVRRYRRGGEDDDSGAGAGGADVVAEHLGEQGGVVGEVGADEEGPAAGARMSEDGCGASDGAAAVAVLDVGVDGAAVQQPLGRLRTVQVHRDRSWMSASAGVRVHRGRVVADHFALTLHSEPRSVICDICIVCDIRSGRTEG